MNDLVVGQRQDIILTGGVGDSECHLIVVEFSEIWIQFHVLQEIMHPAHVPLEGEAETSLFRRFCDTRPCSGLLSDHHGTGEMSGEDTVQMAEELDGFEVLVLAVLIRNPVSIAAAVIQVQHGRDGIYAETVNMEVLYPVEGVSDQEVFDLIFAVIEDLCAPVRVLALSRVRVFIERLTVEVGKSVGILREVGRNPVEDDTDPFFVEVVHKVHELFWSAVTGSRRVVAGNLIAPGTVVWMFRNSHEFYVGVAHLLYIISQLVGSFHICIVTFLLWTVFLAPGTEMDLVDCHRGFHRISFFSCLHPGCVIPFEAVNVFCDRSGSRTEFRMDRIRVSLEQDHSLLCGDREFIEFSETDAGNKRLVDSGVS